MILGIASSVCSNIMSIGKLIFVEYPMRCMSHFDSKNICDSYGENHRFWISDQRVVDSHNWA